MVDITGYGEVDLLAHPMSLACTTVARLQVIGGGHAHRRGWWLIPGAPAECFVPWGRTAVILLDPHPTPCLKSGKVAEAWRALSPSMDGITITRAKRQGATSTGRPAGGDTSATSWS